MDSLMSPGSQLRLLMDSVGFRENRLAEIMGATLDSKLGNNLGAAQNILDAFAPLTQVALDKLTLTGFAPLGFCQRPHLYRSGFDYSPAQMNGFMSSMLSRCTNAQAANDAIYGIANVLNNAIVPNGSFDEQISQLIQNLTMQMQPAIQQKLDTMMPAPPKKKKKKKGLLGKLKKKLKGVGKGFKKIGKMAKGITKMGKGLFKGVLKGVKGIFKGGLKGLFQLGGGLFGGLAGGPLGTNMISQIAGKKKGAKLTQIFGSMTKMFGVIGNVQSGASQFNLQGLANFIRA